MKGRLGRWIVAALGVAAVMVMTPATVSADTQTANLSVSATVVSSCVISSGSLSFGNYDPTSSSNVDQSASFNVACTKGTSATVGLGLGANASGSTRRMTNGADHLSYELYKESGRTNVWGNAGGDLVSLGAAASNGNQSLTVYGRITGSQNVGSGNYSDTVVMTVTF